MPADTIFAAVVDKGTLDVAQRTSGDAAAILLASYARVLAPGGGVFLISEEPSEYRAAILAAAWPSFDHSCRCIVDEDGIERFLYVAWSPAT